MPKKQPLLTKPFSLKYKEHCICRSVRYNYMIFFFFFLAEGESEQMTMWTQDLMSGVTFDWCSPESKNLSSGRLWCLVKHSWLESLDFCGHGSLSTRGLLLVFCPLSALTVPLCPVNCVKSLLKTCHSVLAQCQTDLLVPLFSGD